MALPPLSLSALESEALVVSVIELKADFRVLLTDRKNDKSFHRVSPCGLLWFFCGICTRSRISPCISSHFDYNQALPAS